MVNVAPRSIRYFVALKFSMRKCPTVSPVVFLITLWQKSQKDCPSRAYSPVPLPLLAANNYGNNDTLLQQTGICKDSDSFL